MYRFSVLIFTILFAPHLFGQINYTNDSSYTLAIDQLNQLRIDQNLPTLKLDSRLHDAAQFHAEAMSKLNFFNHINAKNIKMKTPGMRVKAYQYEYTHVAENIAYYESSQPISRQELIKKFYQLWKSSPPHWKNICSTIYDEIGIGFYSVQKGNLTKYYIVQNFGKR